MARISTYNLDEEITGGDKWIGSDSGSYNKTKNFTPVRLADFFNSSQSIDSSNSLRFWYQTLDPLEDRMFGTFSFKTEQGPFVSFSDIQSIIVSKKTQGNIYVFDFLTSLVGSRILIHKGSSINEYAIYQVVSIEEDLNEVDFLEFTLTFIQGNGGLIEDKGYLLSLIDFDSLNSRDKNYIHNQTTPSDQWTVEHNLNKYPSVSVMLPSGHIGMADVTHIDENNLTITFAGDETGKAIMN